MDFDETHNESNSVGDQRREKELRETFKHWLSQLNKETERHSYSVAYECALLSRILQLDVELSYKIGLLHDIGKIYIPSRILKKNGFLTVTERQVIDLHSYYSYMMLQDAGEEPVVAFSALYHHGFNKPKPYDILEKFDASYLPYVFLVHTADIYDAMASKRPYHKPFALEDIIEVLRKDPLCPTEYLGGVKALHHYNENSLSEMVNPRSDDCNEGELQAGNAASD